MTEVEGESPVFDLVVSGGYVIDGTGRPGFLGDVAVEHGKVAAVSRRPGLLSGREVVDASGYVVTPGFIDIHTHADRDIIKHPYAVNYVSQGVTTVVGGNCGGSMGPGGEAGHAYRAGKGPTYGTMAGFLDDVDNTGIGINFATFVGQGNVRAAVMGKEDRAPTAEEMNRMKQVLCSAIEDGAVGITSGRRYMPGCLAGDDEIIELMGALTSYGLLYSSHLKNQNDHIISSVEELLEVGLVNNIPVQLTHLKVTGTENWGMAPHLGEMMEDARRRGIDVMGDVYPYTFSGTMARRLSEDKITEALSGIDLQHLSFDTVLEILRDKGVTVEGRGTANEDDMRHLLAHDYTMVGSDGVVAGDDYGVVGNHPRSFGAFVRVLGRYARDSRLFTLEKAVQKMTQMPAERLKIRDRGILKTDCWADLAILDEAEVCDNSTILNPAATASGIRSVYVNGQPVVRHGKPLCQLRPGRVLRYRGADVR